MPLQLGRLLNKQILVSIPALFEDGRCRPYMLVGVEMYGLWLEGDDLATRLLPEPNAGLTSGTWTAFVPFSQIASVFVATALAAAPSSAPPAAGDPTASPQGINQPLQKRRPAATPKAASRKKPTR